jgi:hypothetical protein
MGQIRNQIISTGATVVCLQETTKISNWTNNLLLDTVGADMVNNVAYVACLPSVGVCGGVFNCSVATFFYVNSTTHNSQYISYN